MSSSAFRKHGFRRAAILHRFGRIALSAVALSAAWLALPPPQAAAESIKVQISNFPTWKEVQGKDVVSTSYSTERLSVLERMQITSRPYVRIENNTSRDVVGVQIDMRNWNAMISAVDWIYTPVDGIQPTWSWNETSQSAFFQFGANPLTFGQAVVMRLGTAPKTGTASVSYNANQTLLSPSSLTCWTNNTGGVCFDVFTNKPGAGFQYNSIGRPVGPGIASTDCLCTEGNLVDIATLRDPDGITMECVVPVPEPGTVVMAASAAAVLALSGLRRLRTRASAAAKASA